MEIAALAELRDARGLYDGRPLLPVREPGRLALIGIHAAEPLAVAIENCDHKMAMLAALIRSKLGKFSCLTRLCRLLRFFHFRSTSYECIARQTDYANCIGFAQLVFGLGRKNLESGVNFHGRRQLHG